MLHFASAALLVFMLGLMLIMAFLRVMAIPRRYSRSVDEIGERAERREHEIDRHKRLQRPE